MPRQQANPKGLIFNVMRFALHDGPGIRTTIFLKGCPLACWWCHNPESQGTNPEVLYAEDKCLYCGDCVRACPNSALRWQGLPVRNTATCKLCGGCVEACAAVATQIAGRWMTVEEAMAEIVKDQVFFDESGGGVTLSGGEPLMQGAFVEALLDACHELRIHVAIDTCGHVSRAILERISRKTDLFLFDLKLIDSSLHELYTGVSNDLILSNLEFLAREQKSIIIRIPLVPGVTDSRDNLEAIRNLLLRTGLRRVDLLPYHEIGLGKYARLQVSYRLQGLKPLPEEEVQGIVQQLSDDGFAVRIGG